MHRLCAEDLAPEDGTLLQVIDVQNNTPVSIAFSPDEQVIAAGSEDRYQDDGLIRFWQFSTGALLQSYHVGDGDPYSTYVTSLVYSPDGKFFAFATTNSHLAVARNPFAPKKNHRTMRGVREKASNPL